MCRGISPGAHSHRPRTWIGERIPVNPWPFTFSEMAVPAVTVSGEVGRTDQRPFSQTR